MCSHYVTPSRARRRASLAKNKIPKKYPKKKIPIVSHGPVHGGAGSDASFAKVLLLDSALQTHDWGRRGRVKSMAVTSDTHRNTDRNTHIVIPGEQGDVSSPWPWLTHTCAQRTVPAHRPPARNHKKSTFIISLWLFIHTKKKYMCSANCPRTSTTWQKIWHVGAQVQWPCSQPLDLYRARQPLHLYLGTLTIYSHCIFRSLERQTATISLYAAYEEENSCHIQRETVTICVYVCVGSWEFMSYTERDSHYISTDCFWECTYHVHAAYEEEDTCHMRRRVHTMYTQHIDGGGRAGASVFRGLEWDMTRKSNAETSPDVIICWSPNFIPDIIMVINK